MGAQSCVSRGWRALRPASSQLYSKALYFQSLGVPGPCACDTGKRRWALPARETGPQGKKGQAEGKGTRPWAPRPRAETRKPGEAARRSAPRGHTGVGTTTALLIGWRGLVGVAP